jgi:hypothetical protein
MLIFSRKYVWTFDFLNYGSRTFTNFHIFIWGVGLEGFACTAHGAKIPIGASGNFSCDNLKICKITKWQIQITVAYFRCNIILWDTLPIREHDNYQDSINCLSLIPQPELVCARVHKIGKISVES